MTFITGIAGEIDMVKAAKHIKRVINYGEENIKGVAEKIWKDHELWKYYKQ